MKKIYLTFILLILSACTPQVTVTSTATSLPPTETLIPTPTLHPEFIALQKLINDSGDRFTLLSDGTIEELASDGTKQVIPNLHVDQNGVINIIFNNEHVVIETSQIAFDNENGLTIEGYELNENSEWVVAMSETEQQMYIDFEKYGQNLDNGNYTVEIGEDEGVTIKDVDGNDVYINGSFEPVFLGQLIVENKMCQQTEWTGAQVGRSLPSDLQDYEANYGGPLHEFYGRLVEQRVITRSGQWGTNYYLGDGCWARVVFRNQTHTTQMDAWYFWKNQLGRPLYEKVFITPEQ